MRLKEFLAVAGIAGLAACSSPYRATDTNGNTTTTTTTPAGTTVIVAPGTVQTAFTTQYPNASNASWTMYDATVVPIDWELAGWNTMDEGDYLVRFDMDSDNYYAWYDDSGNWIGSAYSVKDMTKVPEAVTKAVNSQFAGYTIKSVQREFHKDGMLYEVEATNADTKAKLLVDTDGKIVKQKTKPLSN